MSEKLTFSASVKKELLNHYAKKRNSLLSEIAVYIAVFARINLTKNGAVIYLETENEFVAKRYAFLLKKAFKIMPEVGFMRFRSENKREGGSVLYGIVIRNQKEGLMVYEGISSIPLDEFNRPAFPFIDKELIKDSYSKRALLRGAFIASGTISDPNKSYHFEISTGEKAFAELILEIISQFISGAKIINRKNSYVIYVKEADMVSDMLNVMDAHKALMEFENIRILHNIANQINRQTNCDVANSQKVVSAATKQVNDIVYIQKCNKFNSLPETIQELALLRLEHPDAPLKDLGEMLDPPIGKSGVNHRMRKLSEIAEDLRILNKDLIN